MVYDQFLVVDCPTAYNVIVGRTALTAIKAHLSLHILLMKFPTCYGTGAIRGDQVSARNCYATALKSAAPQKQKETFTVPGLLNGNEPVDDPSEETPTPVAQPAGDLETVALDERQPDRCVRIGTMLNTTLRAEFIQFLRQNSEVFAWSYNDMPGISPDIISHKLSISPAFKPAKGGWRMCQDYTDLNKACLKDSFPLPRIDQLVDATAGHELLSFMDAYSGYNQIFMHPADSEHMAFITDKGLYCYNIMPFGLKNAGATY
ncbi:uncharacterized protein LOC110773737 [Prunus avium]|uniref:Uncharacterized protein LOC110773737 n=1 Tax=Prunus avium TaxID=42229 RepID=A0A6P5U3Q1_PRUAV|nr:uncharacterized protein LOC110773737 [Prunus avium]